MTHAAQAQTAMADESRAAMLALIRDLYPINRSITGDGVRATLNRIAERVPVALHEIPTGTRVLDWEIPREWNVRDAYVATPAGERLIDFRQSNLHVVGYSTPIRRRMSLAELRPHLYSDPQRPGVILFCWGS